MDVQVVAVLMAVVGIAATGLYAWLGLQGVRALRELARGMSAQPTLAVSLPQGTPAGDTAPVGALSEREREVLRLVAQGYDNARIAADLFIAEGTVKNHITNIYGKIGVRTRAEAVAWSWRNGIVEEYRR